MSTKENFLCFGSIGLYGAGIFTPSTIEIGIKVLSFIGAAVVGYFAIKAHQSTIKRNQAEIDLLKDEESDKQDV